MELPTGKTELSRDTRPIKSLLWENDEAVEVGLYCVTQIVPYDENGHMACIPWLAVFHGDELHMRVPADQVTIVYQSQ